MNQPRVLIVIPCFNEERSIAALLQEISDCGQGFETIVVDDGSGDSTYEVARRSSPTVRLARNLGIGGAVQTGIKYAHQKDFDFCVQIDGDGQHPPGEVANLLKAYQQSPSSIIVGSRYLQNDSFRSTWARRFGARAIAGTINALFPRSSVTDPTSGLRLMDRDAIRFFALHYPHDFPEPISLAWALREGFTVSESPVQMRARQHGSSTIVGLRPLIYMVRVLGYIALARLMRTSPR